MRKEHERNQDDHVMTPLEMELLPLEWREVVVRTSVENLVEMGYVREEVLENLKKIQEDIRKVKYIRGFSTPEEQQEALEQALIEGFPPEVIVGDRDDVTLVDGNNTTH